MRKRTLYTYICQTCGKVDSVYRKIQTTTPCYGCAVKAYRESLSDPSDKVTP